jgi:hypothetical protein
VFRRPVAIVDSQVTSDARTGDLVRFVVGGLPDADMPEPAASPAQRGK